MGRPRLNQKAFYECDKIRVENVAGETVTITVRRNRRPFQAQVTKSDFSPLVQAQFAAVAAGVKLRRSNGYFSIA